MIPSEKYCIKRTPIDIPNYIIFNFTDLFGTEQYPRDHEYTINRESMTRYKEKLKNLKKKILSHYN